MGDRERDILRTKSRDDNLRGRDLYKNNGDRRRHIQPIRSRDNSRERDNNRNDKKLRIPWSISQQTALMKLVLLLGVHKCGRNEVVRLWYVCGTK